MFYPRLNNALNLSLILTLTTAFASKAGLFCKTKCSTDNIVCKREPCGLDPDNCLTPSKMLPLTKNQRALIYKNHNTFRNEVANGQANVSQAANMIALSYSLELEFTAQCWANACDPNGTTCRSTPNFSHLGENIHVSEKTAEALTNMIVTDAMDEWFEGIKFFNDALINSYESSSRTAETAQLIWAKTTHIGCGRTRYLDKVLLVCHYGNVGALANENVYVIGKPCDSCTCHVAYTSLCGEARIEDESDKDAWEPPFVLGPGRATKVNVFVMYVLFLVCEVIK